MRSAYHRMYYHLIDRNERNKAMRATLKLIGDFVFFIVALVTGVATYLIVPILAIESQIKGGTNVFIICLSIIICGGWTLGWIAGIQKLVKSA